MLDEFQDAVRETYTREMTELKKEAFRDREQMKKRFVELARTEKILDESMLLGQRDMNPRIMSIFPKCRVHIDMGPRESTKGSTTGSKFQGLSMVLDGASARKALSLKGSPIRENPNIPWSPDGKRIFSFAEQTQNPLHDVRTPK